MMGRFPCESLFPFIFPSSFDLEGFLPEWCRPSSHDQHLIRQDLKQSNTTYQILTFWQLLVTKRNIAIWKYKTIDISEECFQIWLATTSVRNVDKRHAQIRNLCRVCLLHAFHKPPTNLRCSWDRNIMYEGGDCKESKNSSDSEYIGCPMVRAR